MGLGGDKMTRAAGQLVFFEEPGLFHNHWPSVQQRWQVWAGPLGRGCRTQLPWARPAWASGKIKADFLSSVCLGRCCFLGHARCGGDCRGHRRRGRRISGVYHPIKHIPAGAAITLWSELSYLLWIGFAVSRTFSHILLNPQQYNGSYSIMLIEIQAWGNTVQESYRAACMISVQNVCFPFYMHD